MRTIGNVLYIVAFVYLLLLLFRIVMTFVFSQAHDYNPRGAMLVLVESTFTATDPPIRLVRRFVPPLRLGGLVIDLSVTIVILFVWIVVMQLVAGSLANG